MIRSFDFFFDFASPYAYIAHKQIRKIEIENNIRINYMPIFLAGLHSLLNIKANAFIPSKARYMIKDCKLCAEKLKIDFKFNSFFPIKSLEIMRGVLLSEKENEKNDFIDKFFDAIWKDGLNLNMKNEINKILDNLKINTDQFYLDISKQVIKEELKKRTNDALLKGIFGTPSFRINNKMFWGQDRLNFVLEEAQKSG